MFGAMLLASGANMRLMTATTRWVQNGSKFALRSATADA